MPRVQSLGAAETGCRPRGDSSAPPLPLWNGVSRLVLNPSSGLGLRSRGCHRFCCVSRPQALHAPLPWNYFDKKHAPRDMSPARLLVEAPERSGHEAPARRCARGEDLISAAEWTVLCSTFAAACKLERRPKIKVCMRIRGRQRLRHTVKTAG